MKIFFLIIVVIVFGTITFNAFAEEQIPEWVKNNAGWWSDDQISDSTFIDAIEFLIKDEIIVIANTQQNKLQTDVIPEWVKNNAGWWSDDQISDSTFIDAIEFLIKTGIFSISKSNCNGDVNTNNIPDEIEDLPILSGISSSELAKTNFIFQNKDWSDCNFNGDLSFYVFYNVTLTNADFSNTRMINTEFHDSFINNTTFSDSVLHGTVFLNSPMSNIVFENVDFSPNDFDFPFVIFSYHNYSGPTFSCYFKPCFISRYTLESEDVDMKQLLDITFEKDKLPTNLRLVSIINDKSDQRTMWRHVSSFIGSDMHNVLFKNSDLSHSMFKIETLTDVKFSNSDLSNTSFDDILLSNTSLGSEYQSISEIDYLILPKNKSKIILDIDNSQKFSNPKKIDLDIKFADVIDEGLVNWPMDLVIHEQILYVVDTDNHRIISYDVNTLEKTFGFVSPIQEYCDTTNTWTDTTENCFSEMRNLPTSIAFLDEQIFVAYGFQNHIQVFDLQGQFLYKFGNSGSNENEFDGPFRISASENKIFVADSQNHRVQIFDSDGKLLKQFSTSLKESVISTPIDLDIYKNKIFVADSSTSSILVFDLDGKLSNSFLLDSSSHILISGIDVHDELIFLSDATNNLFLILDLNGNLIMKMGKAGNHYGEFNNPQKIISNGKQIFVADSDNYRIQVFDLIIP
ncbi:MAG: pentapeptide repeat-containing protein [Candidatus Nitrosopumilus sp. bin_68KS]